MVRHYFNILRTRMTVIGDNDHAQVNTGSGCRLFGQEILLHALIGLNLQQVTQQGGRPVSSSQQWRQLQ